MRTQQPRGLYQKENEVCQEQRIRKYCSHKRDKFIFPNGASHKKDNAIAVEVEPGKDRAGKHGNSYQEIQLVPEEKFQLFSLLYNAQEGFQNRSRITEQETRHQPSGQQRQPTGFRTLRRRNALHQLHADKPFFFPV